MLRSLVANDYAHTVAHPPASAEHWHMPLFAATSCKDRTTVLQSLSIGSNLSEHPEESQHSPWLDRPVSGVCEGGRRGNELVYGVRMVPMVTHTRTHARTHARTHTHTHTHSDSGNIPVKLT